MNTPLPGRCSRILAVVVGLLVPGCRRSLPPAEAAPAPGVAAHGHTSAGSQTEKHRHHGGHHRFDDAEEWAKQFDDPERDAWQRPDSVVAWLGLAPDATVADIGAGTGYFAVRLARAVPDGLVLANDVEPDMVRYLGERAAKAGLDNLQPVQGTADAPGLERTVDLAFMCDVYHHIADRPTFFARLRERLLGGGRLVIVDFRKDAPDDAPGPPRAMRVSGDEIVSELAPLGFRLTRRDDDLLPYQYVLEFTLVRSSGGSEEVLVGD